MFPTVFVCVPTVFPTVKGNKYILVVTDVFSKWVEAFPLQVTDGFTLTSTLMDEVCLCVFLLCLSVFLSTVCLYMYVCISITYLQYLFLH